jgi:hypothetical protein
LRQNLGNDEGFVASANGLGHDSFSFAVPVHLCRVDMVHAQFEAVPQGGDGGSVAGVLNIPGSPTDHGQFEIREAKPTSLHAFAP